MAINYSLESHNLGYKRDKYILNDVSIVNLSKSRVAVSLKLQIVRIRRLTTIYGSRKILRLSVVGIRVDRLKISQNDCADQLISLVTTWLRSLHQQHAQQKSKIVFEELRKEERISILSLSNQFKYSYFIFLELLSDIVVEVGQPENIIVLFQLDHHIPDHFRYFRLTLICSRHRYKSIHRNLIRLPEMLQSSHYFFRVRLRKALLQYFLHSHRQLNTFSDYWSDELLKILLVMTDSLTTILFYHSLDHGQHRTSKRMS